MIGLQKKERPLKEITCLHCGKKEMRRYNPKYCLSCSTSKYYTPKQNPLRAKCKECECDFVAHESRVKFCTKQCAKINRNKLLNGKWIDKDAKVNEMSHPWKGAAL